MADINQRRRGTSSKVFHGDPGDPRAPSLSGTQAPIAPGPPAQINAGISGQGQAPASGPEMQPHDPGPREPYKREPRATEKMGKWKRFLHFGGIGLFGGKAMAERAVNREQDVKFREEKFETVGQFGRQKKGGQGQYAERPPVLVWGRLMDVGENPIQDKNDPLFKPLQEYADLLAKQVDAKAAENVNKIRRDFEKQARAAFQKMAIPKWREEKLHPSKDPEGYQAAVLESALIMMGIEPDTTTSAPPANEQERIFREVLDQNRKQYPHLSEKELEDITYKQMREAGSIPQE